MSSPVDQLQPPPIDVTQQSAYTAHSGHGSVGPVIAVLAVIIILGVIAGMIGRLCSGRQVFGYGEYDFEGWFERKCSSCIDGRVNPTITRNRTRAVEADNSVVGGVGGGGGGEEAPVEPTQQDIKEETQETEHEQEQPEQEQKQKQPRKNSHGDVTTSSQS